MTWVIYAPSDVKLGYRIRLYQSLIFANLYENHGRSSLQLLQLFSFCTEDKLFRFDLVIYMNNYKMIFLFLVSVCSYEIKRTKMSSPIIIFNYVNTKERHHFI